MQLASRLALFVTLASLCGGCALLRQWYRPPSVQECPGDWVASERLPEGLRWRARVRVTAPGVDAGLELVASLRDGELVLVGLNPFGAKLFVLVQRGTRAELHSELSQVLSVPARNLLSDLHRAHFLALAEEVGEAGRRGVVAGVAVEESWEQGALRERIFPAQDDPAPRVVWEPGEADAYRVEHAACGYRSQVRVLDARGLP